MTNSEGELKLEPCPFCGNSKIYLGPECELGYSEKDIPFTHHEIGCENCITFLLDETRDKAIKHWNTRPSSDGEGKLDLVKSILEGLIEPGHKMPCKEYGEGRWMKNNLCECRRREVFAAFKALTPREATPAEGELTREQVNWIWQNCELEANDASHVSNKFATLCNMALKQLSSEGK